MVIVAIAGGTGGVGRTIAETLQQNPRHKVIILTRKVADTTQVTPSTIPVDYTDVASMAKVLADNNVHTVISALRVFDPLTSDAETSLVRATVQAGVPKRFVASVWGVEYPEQSTVGEARARTLVELRKTNLEWTRFDNGFFLDYYGPPSLKSYMTPAAFAIDMPNKKAGIPGTGDEPMTFTYTFDVAKFMVAALDLPKWDEKLYCYGEKTTWNEFLKLAEDARGKMVSNIPTYRPRVHVLLSRAYKFFLEADWMPPHDTGSKFDVAYDSRERLEKGEITELPSSGGTAEFPKEVLHGLMALWGLFAMDGKYDIQTDKALNRQFPEIRPSKVKDVLEMWQGK